VRHDECHRQQGADRDAERQHAETHADVGLHAPAEQFGAVFVDTRLVCGLHAGVFERDRPPDHRLDENPRKDKGAHAAERTCQHAPDNQSLLHFDARSVAGECEQMARIVGELVHVHVAAEHRHRALIDTDEIDHQQRQQSCR
jgi:hypothetical protein